MPVKRIDAARVSKWEQQVHGKVNLHYTVMHQETTRASP